MTTRWFSTGGGTNTVKPGSQHLLFTDGYAAGILVSPGMCNEHDGHLPLHGRDPLWRSQCSATIAACKINDLSQRQLWGWDCLHYRWRGVEIVQPWEEDGAWRRGGGLDDDTSRSTTVWTLKKISAATIVANSDAQGAWGRRQHGLGRDRVGGVVVVTCSKLCCLWISLFLCQVLLPPPPSTHHGGRLGLSPPQTTYCMCSFIQMMFLFFCFASAALCVFMSLSRLPSLRLLRPGVGATVVVLAAKRRLCLGR